MQLHFFKDTMKRSFPFYGREFNKKMDLIFQRLNNEKEKKRCPVPCFI